MSASSSRPKGSSRMPRILGLLMGLLALAVFALPGTASASEDTEPPRLVSLSFEPSAVDTSSSSQSVKIVAHLTDNLSGVQDAFIVFEAPSHHQSTEVAFTRVSGTGTDGIYEATAQFARYIESGSWEAHVIAVDNAGNNGETSKVELESKGFPGSIAVTSTPDLEPPQVQALTFEPTSINTSSSSQSVKIVAHLTDNLSGVQDAFIVFEAPSHHQSTEVAFTRTRGNARKGTYEATATLQRYAEAGSWEAHVIAVDNAGNNGETSKAELESKGLPGSVLVDPPLIAAVSPNVGPAAGGTTVTITGTGLSNASSVHFGLQEATIEEDSETSIIAIAPPGTGAVEITVTTPVGTSLASGKSAKAARFKYQKAKR